LDYYIYSLSLSVTVHKIGPIGHRLNATAYLNIVSDHIYPFMASDGYFQQDNAPCHKARINSDWFLKHNSGFTALKWPPQSPDLNPIEHRWDVVERELYALDMNPCKFPSTARCYPINMGQHF